MIVSFQAPWLILNRDGDPYDVAVPFLKPAFGIAAVLNIVPRTDRHRIAGTVMVDGLPARRNVVALDRYSLAYVGGTTSDPVTGEWELSGLPEYPERNLLVLALDTTGNYNAEVADYISQVATAQA